SEMLAHAAQIPELEIAGFIRNREAIAGKAEADRGLQPSRRKSCELFTGLKVQEPHLPVGGKGGKEPAVGTEGQPVMAGLRCMGNPTTHVPVCGVQDRY